MRGFCFSWWLLLFGVFVVVGGDFEGEKFVFFRWVVGEGK